MWRVIAERWRSRLGFPLGLSMAAWGTLFGLSHIVDALRPATAWIPAACAVSFAACWFHLRGRAVVDLREDRFALHAVLPLPLGSVAGARVLDPLPGLLLAGLLSTALASAARLLGSDVPRDVSWLILSLGAVTLLIEQLHFTADEVRVFFPDRLLPRVGAWVGLGIAGAIFGYAGARSVLGDGVLSATLLDVLRQPASSLSILAAGALLALLNRRLFQRRPDFLASLCAW